MKKIIVLSFIALAIVGCKKFLPEGSAPVQLKENLNADYKINIPYQQLVDNTPADNQLTNNGAALGRVLFYDTRLSIDNNTACATCHKQEDAFADGLQFSTGFEGGLTTRNSMALCNLVNSKELFWDGRTQTLEQLALEPVSHPVEMGFEKLDLLPKKLALTDYYAPLFAKAFGSEDITEHRIAQAIAQFIRSMASYSAPIDNTSVPHGSWNPSVPNFTASEKAGLQLFSQSGCANCHTGANFGGTQFDNIGLEINYSDAGMGTKGSKKEGFFKVPSLRNIELTAPYMHDGRFATLKEVLEHYSENIQPHSNLSPILTNASWNDPTDNSPIRFKFSAQNITDLEAFLKTMTDQNLVKNEKYSDPFIRQ